MIKELQHLFPALISPLASLMISASLIFLIARLSKVKDELRLLAASCMVAFLWNFSHIFACLLPESRPAAVLSDITRPLPVLILPLILHLVHRFLDIRGRTAVLWAVYPFSFVMAGVFWMNGNLKPGMAPYLLVLAALGCAYVVFCFLSASSLTADRDGRLSRLLLASGSVVFLILSGLDPIAGGQWPAMGFSFAPLMLISSGLAVSTGEGADAFPFRENLFRTSIIGLMMFPLICDLIFLLNSLHYLHVGGLSSPFFNYTLITMASILIAATLALLAGNRARDRVDALLYTVVCLLVCILNFRYLIATGLPELLSRQIVTINDIFLVSLIGVCGHLTLSVCRRSKDGKTLLFYAPGLLLIPLLWHEPHAGSALLPYTGPGRLLFAAMLLAMLIWCAFSVLEAHRGERNPDRRKGTAFMASGIIIGVLILAGCMATGLGLSAFPFSSLAFIPLILVGHGIFFSDIRRMGVHARRQMTSRILRLLLCLLYLVFAFGIAHILKDYPFSHILERVVPYGIPPMLSFLCAGFLSLFVLGLERNRPESQLFSLISFCYAVLNLDIFLVGVVSDIRLALFISRIDHFFLVLLLLGVNAHLIYLVIGKKNRWWVVYAAYIAGIVMAPLTQTDYYFSGMHSYFFGFFAKKAFLYDIMSTLWGAGILYGIYLLFRASKDPQTRQLTRVRRTLTAFIILAVLSLSNNPAIYGYEVYPLGTFIFVALLYLAYGLFKFNLKAALKYVRIILFWSGLMIAMTAVGLFPGLFLNGERGLVGILTGILLVTVLFQPVGRGWSSVLNLFTAESADTLKDSYYRLTDNLSRLHHRETIHRIMYSWFFENLETSCFVSLFSLPDLSGKRVFFGWKTWNVRSEGGLFGNAAPRRMDGKTVQIGNDHPLIKICKHEQTLFTQETLLRMNPSIHAFDGGEGLLKDSEIVIPVISKGDLFGVMILGGKIDGSSYSSEEFDILQNIFLVLGPLIENAMLLEGLEEKVELRTRELNRTLAESVRKEKEIRESSETIGRQNQIFRTLLETSTRIHHMENLDELFSFILSQLHTLFSDFRGGIILENPRRGILEATSFIGISEAEQKVILEKRSEIMAPDFGRILNKALSAKGIPSSAEDMWTVFPMESRGNKVVGHMIFKGQELDRLTKEIFTVFLGQLSAVTENRLLMIQLERMASTDGLTGLYNRSFLNQELKKVIQHAKRFRNIHFSIMIVDVNGLKKVNDTYGHEKGDEVIVRTGRFLKSICRQTDIVSRLGGDEFAILMPSTNLSQAEILYRRILEASPTLAISMPKQGEKKLSIPIHMSIGIASSDDTPPEDVMKKADAMMYTAKGEYYACRETARG